MSSLYRVRPINVTSDCRSVAALLFSSRYLTGNESGGHGRPTAPSTMVLLSEVLAALSQDNAPPVLAAGGIANGAQIAAYLTAGASGAVLGTRFLLTPESPYSSAQKAILQAAKSKDTVRSLAFDLARGTNHWPEGIDGRGVRNKIVEDIDAGVEQQTVQERFRRAAEVGDPNYLLVWSGQGITLIDEIQPAKVRCCGHRGMLEHSADVCPHSYQHVVEDLHQELIEALRRAQRLLV
ncbi:NPD-domain-containing protein [Trametes cingulata]|nr:NPD-domain-containing protein [Trametes cingulata]